MHNGYLNMLDFKNTLNTTQRKTNKPPPQKNHGIDVVFMQIKWNKWYIWFHLFNEKYSSNSNIV